MKLANLGRFGRTNEMISLKTSSSLVAIGWIFASRQHREQRLKQEAMFASVHASANGARSFDKFSKASQTVINVASLGLQASYFLRSHREESKGKPKVFLRGHAHDLMRACTN